MGTSFIISTAAFFILCHTHFTTTSRIRIENNGYENVLVSLPSEVAKSDRKGIVSSIKDLFQDSSSILSRSTKGRAHFRSVTFLVPRVWGEMESWLPNWDNTTSFDDAGAATRRQGVDVVVQYSTNNFHPYVLHQASCGRRALRIYLSTNYLMSGDRKQKGVEFIRLWSEFRYGVFPEGGFDGDPKYPYLYQLPGDSTNITTGCNSELLRQRKELGKCSDDDITSSLMDQHLPNTAIHFCENFLNLGPRHNPDAPSKHNLLCNEEGTWFTVLRSPDFFHGRNAASKSSSNLEEVTYQFVREVASPRVVVAIDISSRMNKEKRYHLTKNAFSQFVISMLPDDSDLSLLLFGGDANIKVVTSNLHLTNDDARTSYLESLPLPDEPLLDDYTCIDCVLEDIIDLVTNENSTFESAPIVILVTAEHHFDNSKFQGIQKKLETTEILLQVMAFTDDYSTESLYDLCLKTGNKFITLEEDVFSNLYNSFHQIVKGPISNILIYQDYLITLDEENIRLPFILDESVAEELRVSISGPSFHTSSTLEYDKTILIDPSGNAIQSKKYELIPSLNFRIRNPKAGVYSLKTRRKRSETSPVLVSIYGTPVSVEDPITLNVWTEISGYKVSPPPIQIFAEVRKGPYPIKNATVKAYVKHPGGYVEDFHLFDDGLGSVDITEGDGVYSHYFTNFSSVGFYNVNVKVTEESGDYSIVLKGPSTYCCGTSFPSSEEVPTGRFQRQAGPVTFRVTSVPEDDHYPPARVTDLRVARAFDQIIALQWTSVGNDFDSGEAAAYELKLFRDRSTVRNRFSDSGMELYSETIAVPSPTSYGTDLYHVLKFPSSLEKGVYYFGIRALDDAGNAGEPSNAVAVWIGKNKSTTIDCSDEPIAEKINSSYRQSPFSFFILFIIILTFL